MGKFVSIKFVLFFLILVSVPLYSQTFLSARLTREQAVQADTNLNNQNSQNLTGSAAFIMQNNELRFIVTIGRDGVSGNDSLHFLQSVHFHLGGIGEIGKKVKTFTASPGSNTITGSWSRTDVEQPLGREIRESLLKGSLYIIAMTDSGEIRGQIRPASGTGFVTQLTGPQINDTINTAASGTGSFLLTDMGLVYLITVQGLSISAANIHKGAPGVEGPSVFPLTFNGNTVFGLWRPEDTTPLTQQRKIELLAEDLYVKIASPTYPEGEIRGQILHANGFAFSTQLQLKNPNRPATPADSVLRPSGSASYTLTESGLVYHINIHTQSHTSNLYIIDNTTGMRIKDVPDYYDTSFSGTWLKDDEGIPLSDAFKSDLLQGKLSLEIKTGLDTLRGVITPHKGTNFSTMLSGPQERPKVMSHATGVGHFMLTNEGLRYHITLEGIDTITGAHFHNAPIGVNGGVVKDIVFDSLYAASGIWAPTDAQPLSPAMIDALLKGDIYVNVHTPEHPAGEIRGQLVPASGTDFTATITGRQEMPVVALGTKGTGNFILTNEGLVYKITVDSLNITGARFQNAPIGVIGGVVKDITGSFDGTTTVKGVWRKDDSQPLTDELINDLLKGNLYINFTTAEYPEGAIRGQIRPNGGWGFVSSFDTSASGDNPAFAHAVGNGFFTLNDAGLRFDVAIAQQNITSVTLMNGDPEQGGTPIQQFSGNFGNNTASVVWLMANDTAATASLPLFFNNNLFVSVQTDSTRLTGKIAKEFVAVITYVQYDNSVPSSFVLEQNYPNPFNPSTTIRFSIPDNGAVNLSVFNVIGEKIATLLNEDMKVGSYEVSFNAKELPSGIYFYRLSYNNNIVTRKMLMLK